MEETAVKCNDAIISDIIRYISIVIHLFMHRFLDEQISLRVAILSNNFRIFGALFIARILHPTRRREGARISYDRETKVK